WAARQRFKRRKLKTMATVAEGKITQIIGAVIDVEFPRDSIPHIYDALKLKEGHLTLEVQQQLGDGVVRAIAMGSSEGLRRGLAVMSTGAPIQVPVGQDLLVTGIKVIDLLVPFAKGGKVGLFGGAGVGKTVNMLELINNIAKQ